MDKVICRRNGWEGVDDFAILPDRVDNFSIDRITMHSAL